MVKWNVEFSTSWSTKFLFMETTLRNGNYTNMLQWTLFWIVELLKWKLLLKWTAYTPSYSTSIAGLPILTTLEKKLVSYTQYFKRNLNKRNDLKSCLYNTPPYIPLSMTSTLIRHTRTNALMTTTTTTTANWFCPSVSR